MKSFLLIIAVFGAFASAKKHNCDAGGGGDPRFSGFDGSTFIFRGYADGYFNIFSDPWINVNSQFDTASHTGGTIMKSFGIKFEDHSVLIEVKGAKDKSWEVQIDGESRIFDEESDTHGFSDCIFLQWSEHNLKFTTPRHVLHITQQQHDHHIEKSFLDFTVTHYEQNPYELGGIIGQTAADNNTLSTASSDFVVDTIWSILAHSHFLYRPIKCDAEFERESAEKLSRDSNTQQYWSGHPFSTPQRNARYTSRDCEQYDHDVNACNNDPNNAFHCGDSTFVTCSGLVHSGTRDNFCALLNNGDVACIHGGACCCECNVDDDCAQGYVCTAPTGCCSTSTCQPLA